MSAYDDDIEACRNGTWTGLVRSGTPQDTIHRADCAYLGARVLPWRWAVGKSATEIYAAVQNGIKFCGHCDPLAANGDAS